MPRAKVILQSEFPYSVTARCINKEWFSIPMPQVWEIMCDELRSVAINQNLLIHSFILMSNHFHLIASTPEANISKCMHQFMGRTSLRLTRLGNRINQTYAGRHYKCILQHPIYFLNAYKYNYRNPVSAAICDRVELYPFSTLQSLLGLSNKPFPMAEDTIWKSDPAGTLAWLNSAPEPQKYEAMRNGLKHQYFKSRLCKNTKNPTISFYDKI